MFTNKLLHKEYESKRQSIEGNHTDSLIKGNVPSVAIGKVNYAEVLWDVKGLITIDFLEKWATLNNASNC